MNAALLGVAAYLALGVLGFLGRGWLAGVLYVVVYVMVFRRVAACRRLTDPTARIWYRFFLGVAIIWVFSVSYTHLTLPTN